MTVSTNPPESVGYCERCAALTEAAWSWVHRRYHCADCGAPSDWTDAKIYVRRVGARIRKLRKIRGWTQGQLASFIGYDQGAVGHWETGKAYPRPAAVLALARVFAVHPDRLISYRLLSDESQSVAEVEEQDD